LCTIFIVFLMSSCIKSIIVHKLQNSSIIYLKRHQTSWRHYVDVKSLFLSSNRLNLVAPSSFPGNGCVLEPMPSFVQNTAWRLQISPMTSRLRSFLEIQDFFRTIWIRIIMLFLFTFTFYILLGKLKRSQTDEFFDCFWLKVYKMATYIFTYFQCKLDRAEVWSRKSGK